MSTKSFAKQIPTGEQLACYLLRKLKVQFKPLLTNSNCFLLIAGSRLFPQEGA